MNYVREAAFAIKQRAHEQFGLRIEQEPVERVFQQFADHVLSVYRAQAEGTPIQPLVTFDFSEIGGIEVEEPAVKDTPKPAPAAAKKASKP